MALIAASFAALLTTNADKYLDEQGIISAGFLPKAGISPPKSIFSVHFLLFIGSIGHEFISLIIDERYPVLSPDQHKFYSILRRILYRKNFH